MAGSAGAEGGPTDFHVGRLPSTDVADAPRRSCWVEKLKGRKVLLPRVLTTRVPFTCAAFLPTSSESPAKRSNGIRIHGAEEDVFLEVGSRSRLNKPEGFEAVVWAPEMLSRGEFDALIHPGGHGFYSLFGGDQMIGGTLKRFPNLCEPLR